MVMKDKEKQINDLANTLYNRQHTYDLSNPFEVAKCVIDLGYRKLPKDARVFIPTDEQYIMLSREEYQKDFSSQFNKGYKYGSKETAEKIYQQLQGHGTTYVKKWIEKEFGLEIKE